MAKVKTLKKQWYPIIAPKLFRNAVLGETLVYDPERMIGKPITQNLMNLTSDVKRQNININFEIVEVKDDKAYTNIVGYNMVQSSVKRLVRRDINKIDMSFKCSTSDKKTICIKPILITRAATSGSIAAKIRKNAQEFLTRQIGSISYDAFTNDLISHKLQSTLKAHLKKVYPLRICEIRSMHIARLEKNVEEESKKPKAKKQIKQEKKVEEVAKEEPKKVVEKPKEAKAEEKALKEEPKKTVEKKEAEKVPSTHDLKKAKEEKSGEEKQ